MQAAHLTSPPRPTTSQGSSSILKPLTLRPSHSNPALSPTKLAPALRLEKSSETSQSSEAELWAPTVDADGAYIRRTYAYFDQQGVAGDGWDEGREWTRERGASSPWQEAPPTSRLKGSRSTLLKPSSSLANTHSAVRQSSIESLQIPPNTAKQSTPRPTSSLSILSVTQSEESLLSAPTHTPASLRTPATTVPEDDAIDEQVRLAKESVLGSIDRSVNITHCTANSETTY